MRWFNINVLLREKKKSIIIATLPLTLNITKVIKLSGADLYRKCLIGGGMDRKMEGLKNKNSKILGTWFCFFLPLRAPSPSPFKPMAIPL